MTKGKLDVSPDLQLPEDAVTRAFALLAMKGAGKSNVAVVMAEEMFDAGIPWVAIDPKGDWWGIRSSANGKGSGLPVPIFGGLHADVPIEASHGARMADLIVDNHLTCLVDVSEMSKRDSITFLTAFFERLYRRKSKATYPMHLFLEECDDYVPQRVYKEISNLVRQVELVVKRGRQRGLGITLATQRSASVNKDVLTQTDTLIALRSTAKLDRDAIEGWMDFHAGSKAIVAELPTLENGEAWVSSPEHLRILAKVRFRRRRTFDSGATPELGETVKAPTLGDIAVDAISSAFAETIEKAKADDPVVLRRRIAQLEKAASPGGQHDPDHTWEDVAGEYFEQLRKLEQELEAMEPQTVDVPVLEEELVLRLEQALEPVAGVLGEVQERLAWETKQSGDVIEFTRKLRDRRPDVPRARAAGGGPRAVADRPGPGRTPQRADPPTRREPGRAAVPRPAAVAGDVELGDYDRDLLTVLAQSPTPRRRNAVAQLAGKSARSSSVDKALARLRANGYIEGTAAALRATPAGVEALGDVQALPEGRELVEHWMRRLKRSEVNLLRVLLDEWPEAMARDDVAIAAGHSTTSSSVDKAIAELRALELVEGPGSALRATDVIGEAARS